MDRAQADDRRDRRNEPDQSAPDRSELVALFADVGLPHAFSLEWLLDRVECPVRPGG
jgi:hypothetical protein